MTAYEHRGGDQSSEPPPQPGYHPDDAWKELIARYLVRRCDMGTLDIFEVLRDCELDEVMRARYLRVARETMP